MRDLRSPLAKALDEWLNSAVCETLVKSPITVPGGEMYMRNRLERAFIAGYDAATMRERLPTAGSEGG